MSQKQDKKAAFRLAQQAGFAYDYAMQKGVLSVSQRGSKMRKRRTQRYIDIGKFERKPKERTKKPPYMWGTLGAQVIEPIHHERGQSRKVIKAFQRAEAYKAKCKARRRRKVSG